MHKPHVLLKITVVTSSVLLLGGFVAYRAGAFDKYINPTPQSPPAVLGGSKSKTLVEPTVPDSSGANPTAVPTVRVDEPTRAIMSGSKSITWTGPNVSPQPTPPETAKPNPPK